MIFTQSLSPCLIRSKVKPPDSRSCKSTFPCTGPTINTTVMEASCLKKSLEKSYGKQTLRSLVRKIREPACRCGELAWKFEQALVVECISRHDCTLANE